MLIAFKYPNIETYKVTIKGEINLKEIKVYTRKNI